MIRVRSLGMRCIALVAIVFACALALLAVPAHAAEGAVEAGVVESGDAGQANETPQAGDDSDDASVPDAPASQDHPLDPPAEQDPGEAGDDGASSEPVDETPASDGASQEQPEEVDTSYEDSCVNMYRLYNPNSGEHFYTADVGERMSLVDAGWRYEGVGWAAPRSGISVHRLYSGTDHHYTMDVEERDALERAGWTYEGIGWYSDFTRSVPLYRQFNPNVDPTAASNNSGSHNYTVSKSENDSLARGGWSEEGIAWYAVREKGDDALFLGSFFADTPNEGAGFETVLCCTRDGMSFDKLSTPFTNVENPFHDPSIMCRDGWFYVLSNWNRDDDRFYPMISYSRDLVEWSEPEGLYLINGGAYEGISLSTAPFGMESFDVVAPEWFVDDDGAVYILFSAGYFGAFHGEPENDRMKPYLARVDISHDGFSEDRAPSGKRYPKSMRIEFSPAFELKGLDVSDNYIDGSLYEESGTYYLIIKKNGVINQIYRNEKLSERGWRRVNDGIAVGNEGPSLARIDGAYMLYTDQISTYHGRMGVQVSASTALGGRFSKPLTVSCRDVDGARVALRHGSVMRVEGEARAAVERLLASR